MPREPMVFPASTLLGWGNRGSSDIIDLILRICEEGALKTHIMYQCNLNSKQVEEYLNFLLTRNLVSQTQQTQNPRRPLYLTTDRGGRFLAAYDELEAILRPSG